MKLENMERADRLLRLLYRLRDQQLQTVNHTFNYLLDDGLVSVTVGNFIEYGVTEQAAKRMLKIVIDDIEHREKQLVEQIKEL